MPSLAIMGKLTEILQLAQNRARELKLSYEGALTPAEAWQILQGAPGAKLVDVRTHAELEWVGRIPGAIEIEWLDYPNRQRNPGFIRESEHATRRPQQHRRDDQAPRERAHRRPRR